MAPRIFLIYFDNFMFFYVFSKVGFSKTSCFTCLERLGVSKNDKTPSVFACLTRKHIKTRSFAALFRHPVGKTSCLCAIFWKCVQNTRVFSVLFSCLKPFENVVFLRCFSTARKHRVFAVERRFWEHFLSNPSCLVWFPGWWRKKHRVLRAPGSRWPLFRPFFWFFIVFLRSNCDL